MSATELAKVTGWSVTRIRALLDALVALGYVTGRVACYGLSQMSREYLVRGGRNFMGDVVDLVVHPAIWLAMGRVADVERSGGPASQVDGGMSIVDDMHYWVDFAERGDWLSHRAADVMAATLQTKGLGKDTWVLDVGCGNGLCALTLTAANPFMNAILVDRAEVLRSSEKHAKRLGVADRVTLLPGDAFEVLPTREVDIVIVSQLLHHYNIDTCSSLVSRLAGCLSGGGRIVIHEYLRGEEAPSETWIALLGAMMAVCTEGEIHTLADYRRILREGGFGDCEVVEVVPTGDSWLIIAKKG